MTTTNRGRQPTWQEVAHALGQRLSYAACSVHRDDELEPERCPFCADRAAYLMYRAKADKASKR